MKKIISILTIVLLAIIAVCPLSFAANNLTLTVTGDVAGRTLSIYKLFNLTVEDNDNKIETIKEKLPEIKEIKLVTENEDKTKKYRIISTKIERILWAIWKKGIVPINNVLNRKIFFSRHGVFFKRGRQVLQGAGCRWREAFCGVYAAKDGETQQRKAAARIVQH